jgi:uncharacterized repeat protein (TIGR03943 family)
MDDRTQGALLLAVGGICLRLGLTDAALAYVKTSLQPPLVATGVVLLVLGVGSLVRAFRGPAHDDDPAVTDDLATTEHAAVHGIVPEFDTEASAVDTVAEAAHDHAHGPAVAWLLVLPLLALLLVAPPPLGAFAAGRQSSRPPTTTQTTYPPLPAMEAGAVPLAMTEFVFRALYDPDRSLEGAPIRLTGFVTPHEDGEGFLLTRFTLNCCAADANAVSVQVLNGGLHEADTWLEVVGTWEPRPGVEPGTTSLEPPLLRAQSVQTIPAPSQPYEY